MTREEAIKRLETHIVYHQNGTWPFTKTDEAMEMAIAALREQEDRKAILVQQYIKVPVPPEWISVEDRLPEEWKEPGGDLINYLIFMPEYGVDVGNYAKPVKTWLCVGVPCKVTHWMPLPEQPTEEES